MFHFDRTYCTNSECQDFDEDRCGRAYNKTTREDHEEVNRRRGFDRPVSKQCFTGCAALKDEEDVK